MKVSRRVFVLGGIAGLAAFSTHGMRAIARTLSASTTARTATTATVIYTPEVRAQVFEVIVRQAMAGAPWREICQGPMIVNAITERQIEAEVTRRRRLLKPTYDGIAKRRIEKAPRAAE